MGLKKDIKGSWRDSKKFANKHPVVALLVAGTGAFTAAQIYYTSWVATKAFESVAGSDGVY